jgi:hypothetical protein
MSSFLGERDNRRLPFRVSRPFCNAVYSGLTEAGDVYSCSEQIVHKEVIAYRDHWLTAPISYPGLSASGKQIPRDITAGMQGGGSWAEAGLRSSLNRRERVRTTNFVAKLLPPLANLFPGGHSTNRNPRTHTSSSPRFRSGHCPSVQISSGFPDFPLRGYVSFVSWI